ncbi:MAG: tetratricopeptide repeat protein, partial [Myxococcales bacterium]|nr:tetratricopeptide repeat protein [Myxococcales bacterium]
IRSEAMVELGVVLALSEGRSSEAIDVLELAEALNERVGAPFIHRAHQRQALAEALLAQGKAGQAKAIAESLLAEATEDSVSIPATLMILGRVADSQHEYAQALGYADQVIERIESDLGPEHPLLASPLTNRGLALQHLDRTDDARRAFERSVALRREQAAGGGVGARRRLAEVLINFGNLESSAGDGERAADHYREALTLLPKHDEANRSLLLFNLGVDHQIAGRQEEALANYREALRLAEARYPPSHPRVVGSRLGVGSMLVSLERVPEAREPLERALADWPQELRGSVDEAELCFALAQALRILDGDGERVRALAGDAREIYEGAGLVDEVMRIDSWSKAP